MQRHTYSLTYKKKRLNYFTCKATVTLRTRLQSSAKCTQVIYVLTYRHRVSYDQKQRVGGAEPDSLRSVESQVKHDRAWSPQRTGDRYRQLVLGRGNLAGKRKSVDHVPLVMYDWSVESCRPTTGHVRLASRVGLPLVMYDWSSRVGLPLVMYDWSSRVHWSCGTGRVMYHWL